MSLPLWGELQKALDNTQTISEAIVEAITEHENDPTAHLGTGESLEQHKKEAVIDHPARSVFDDKFAFDRNVFDLTFNTLDPFSITAGVELNGVNSVLFSSPNASTNRQLYGPVGDMFDSDIFYYQLNPRIITTIMLPAITSQLGYIIVGERDEGRGFGFKISDDKLYGLYYKADYSEDTLELITLTTGTLYKLEAVVTYPSQIDFYVNNVLIDSFTSASLVTSMDFILSIPWIDWKSTTSSTKYLYVNNFHWEADIST